MRGWPFFLFLLGLDILSKNLAIQHVPEMGFGRYPFGGIGIFSLGGVTFSLNYTTNTGAAWGLFAGHSGLLFLIRMGIILGIIYLMPKRFPVWLIVIGAIGNAIDYCLYRHVVDFFHFTFWGYSFPIFNIADACITLGVLALLLLPKKFQELKS